MYMDYGDYPNCHTSCTRNLQEQNIYWALMCIVHSFDFGSCPEKGWYILEVQHAPEDATCCSGVALAHDA